jgi:hypothetical protein
MEFGLVMIVLLQNQVEILSCYSALNKLRNSLKKVRDKLDRNG